MSNLKIVWQVAEPSTGRFRSFHPRGWPTGYMNSLNGNVLFNVSCEEGYRPAAVKTGDHKELTLRIADWSIEGNGFNWRTIKQKFATLVELKEYAAGFYDRNPNFLPTGDKLK